MENHAGILENDAGQWLLRPAEMPENPARFGIRGFHSAALEPRRGVILSCCCGDETTKFVDGPGGHSKSRGYFAQPRGEKNITDGVMEKPLLLEEGALFAIRIAVLAKGRILFSHSHTSRNIRCQRQRVNQGFALAWPASGLVG